MAIFISSNAACNFINMARQFKETMPELTWVTIGEIDGSENSQYVNRDKIYILQEWIQRDLEKIVDEQLDGREYSKNRLLFIKTELVDKIAHPTLYGIGIIFSFAVNNTRDFDPKKLFKVYLDTTDISDQINYRSSIDNRTNKSYQVVQGVFNPKGYIDPAASHVFIVALKDIHGIEYRNTMNFGPLNKGVKATKDPQGTILRDDNSIELTDNLLIPLGKAIECDEFKSYGVIFVKPGDRVWQPDTRYMGYIADIENRANEMMKESRFFPNDTMIFFNAFCHLDEPQNPPDLLFSFLLPYGEIKPEDVVKVLIDNKECTQDFAFSQRHEKNRLTNICIGKYFNMRLLDPNVEHTFDIIVTPFKGRSYKRTLQFNVPYTEILYLNFHGFPIDQNETGLIRPPKRDKLQFTMFIGKSDYSYRFDSENETKPWDKYRPSLTIDENLFLNPDNWHFEYEDGSPAPRIKSIIVNSAMERVVHLNYLVQLEEELPREHSKLYLMIQTEEGLQSNRIEIM